MHTLWGCNIPPKELILGHMPTGSYSRKGVLLPSRCLLESPFLEPLLRTLLPIKPTARHLLRTLLRTFSKAISRTLLRTLLRRVRCCAPPLVCALNHLLEATGFNSLSFLSFSFEWKWKPPRKTRNLCPYRSSKIPGQEGEMLKRTNSRNEKKQGLPTSKKRKDRVRHPF